MKLLERIRTDRSARSCYSAIDVLRRGHAEASKQDDQQHSLIQSFSSIHPSVHPSIRPSVRPSHPSIHPSAIHPSNNAPLAMQIIGRLQGTTTRSRGVPRMPRHEPAPKILFLTPLPSSAPADRRLSRAGDTLGQATLSLPSGQIPVTLVLHPGAHVPRHSLDDTTPVRTPTSRCFTRQSEKVAPVPMVMEALGAPSARFAFLRRFSAARSRGGRIFMVKPK